MGLKSAHFSGPQFIQLQSQNLHFVSISSKSKTPEPSDVFLRAKMASRLSNGTTLFRGCRNLLHSLKSTSQAYSSAAAISSKGKPKASSGGGSGEKSDAGEKSPSGLFKSFRVSPALASFLGRSESSRSDAVKQIWSHIKLNNLQNPGDKRQINCDEKLKALFDGREKVGFLEIGKFLSPHFVKSS